MGIGAVSLATMSFWLHTLTALAVAAGVLALGLILSVTIDCGNILICDYLIGWHQKFRELVLAMLMD